MKPEQARLLLLDVDGVLTDGHLWLHPDGTETKCFHVHDGLGLVQVLRAGLSVVVISARASAIVEERMRELGVTEVHLGVEDKYACACGVLERLGCSWDTVVCVGDDLVDLPMMEAAGVAVAVADARVQAQHAADWVTPNRGGRGAVRDVCDWLLQT